MNNPLFTIHRMFTLYHYENINKTKGEQCEQLNPKNFYPPHHHRIAVMVAGNRPETR
nr:Uncharacterised protein [Klebsiella pneumoniae]